MAKKQAKKSVKAKPKRAAKKQCRQPSNKSKASKVSKLIHIAKSRPKKKKKWGFF